MLRKADVTLDFDHHRPVSEADPDETYAHLRATCPVSWTERHGGYWTLAGYDDVNAVFKDYKSFSSDGAPSIPSLSFKVVPTSLDPPLHSAYRRVLNALLSRDVVADQLVPRVREWTTRCLDAVIEQGTCDLIYDVALRVPAAVTLEWAGWDDLSELEAISVSSHNNLAYPPGHELRLRAEQDLVRFAERIVEQLEERRANPRADGTVLARAAAMEIDGAHPPFGDVVSLVQTAILGGIDTTGTLVANALVHLHHVPEQRQQLIDDPGLWPTATEEFLRRHSPVRNLSRKAAVTAEIGGCPIQPGDQILLGTGSANLDEAVFERPFDVVLDRTPNRHFAFGAGIHKCVGLHLARAEFIEIMRQILERMPDYRLLEDQLIPYPSQGVNNGWMKLPAEFTPGTPRLTSTTTRET